MNSRIQKQEQPICSPKIILPNPNKKSDVIARSEEVQAIIDLGRDLSGPPVLPRIHAVSSGRLVHNPLPFPDMGPVQNLGKGERG